MKVPSLFDAGCTFAAAGLLALVFVPASIGQEFTLQIGTPPPPPTPLVSHGDVWRYRLGNTAPGAGWQTTADAALDASWLSAPGGFGFSNDYAPETNRCATVVSAMFGAPGTGTSTLYSRKSFEITGAVDPARRLSLTVDFDDGFVAYLDGVEIARFNAPGGAGTEPANTAVATASHESSNGNPNNTPLPPMTFDLGLVGGRLAPGTHTLAVLGMNRAADSSDFVLVADLSVVGGGSQTTGGGALFAIAATNAVTLSGTNTIPNAARVLVNGDEAAFNPGSGQWSHAQSLAPGLNPLFVAAVDSTGVILASIRRDVLYETAGTPVSGTVTTDTVWDGANGVIRVNGPVGVPAGVTLRITNAAVVLFSATGALRTTNGTIAIDGTAEKPILFAPEDGATPWGDLVAVGAGGALTMRHGEVVAGQVRALNGGSVTVEDSTLRDLNVTGRELVAAVSGNSLVLRRVYGARFGEMDSTETPVLIEDCLLEGFSVDGLDIKSTLGQALDIRRTTVRRADPSNSNADGFDFGPGAGRVDRCLIYGFPDKGISLGGAPGTVISHSLIYGCGSGIGINASSNCWFENTTISGCATGLFFRAAGTSISHLDGTNNILWNNANTIAFTGNSTLGLSFCDVQGGFPGAGNINADPLFVDAAAGDFRLAPGSPARNAGLGGVSMGPDFSTTIGGLPPAPFELAAVVSGLGSIELRWNEDADNESGFELERSTDRQTWTVIASPASGGLTANVRSFVDSTAALNQRYYYRARAVGAAGASAYSNISGAVRREANLVVGGTLAVNTTWTPAQGTILVMSSVTVPTNVTLTIAAGTVVKVTNSAGIRAVSGGAIHVAGTVENKVTVMPMVPGTQWTELSGQFTGTQLTIQHADISGGQITVYSNAVGLIEDSFIHDYRLLSGGTLFTSPIILTHYAAPTVVRRCHIREYHETLWRNGVLTIEESLFENVYGDAVDFDSAQPGTVVRWCTFRHGDRGNVDAVDVGPGDIPGSFDVRIENSMMFDFPFDKGVSVGDRGSSHGTIVSNCFIFSCLSGVMAKDLCDVSVRNSTIVNNNWGLTNYNKVNPSAATGAGITTNTYNNIIWNNGITISMVNDGQLYADHNILGNTNWPGDGNIDIDPLFVNPAANDFRLQPGSPAYGAGRDGATLGATFPVGCPMVLSHPRITAIATADGKAVVKFWADNEKSYSLVSSEQVAGAPWTKVADVAAGALVPQFISVTNSIAANNRFYRLVTPQAP